MLALEDELARAAAPGDAYLSIGVFDGVHSGHRHLLALLKREAARADCIPAVVTFRNHPRAVLNPGLAISSLTTLEERICLLREIGVEVVVPVTFTQEVSLLAASQFVALLQGHMRMRGLVVGPDFALGHNREGTPEVLRALGTNMGFTVTVADAYTRAGSRVSSSAIRNALAQGEVATASRLLGRHYALTGEVVHGAGRGGRMLGYPTANLAVDNYMALPADSIYATWAYVDGRRYQAATSIGVRPTFGAGERTIEAFLLDFHGDLYGKRLRLEFVKRLRDETRFDSAEALRRQMEADVEETRRVLTASG
ncbi:MAG: bifunctional riboflavin kinase/FAD synthetase [Chloroflexi bacterium]|nr:bifunctional riboflavin kinase/FAD synthetase [Chloroflexota bacterium]